jgi:chloramphenicol-sensitive protein RarD
VAEPDETRRGLLYGVAAYAMWGVFPLYFPLLEPAGALEILAQRMVWSLVVVIVVLTLTRGFGRVAAIIRNRRQRTLLMSGAVFVSVNWGVYIWGVNSHHVVETSLGYFINPLFTILLGVLVLGERMRPWQWVAVGIGALAIVVISVDYGRLPWIALTLAASFGLYGFVKKQAAAPALESLVVETATQFLPALIALSIIAAQGDLVFGRRPATTVLLAGAGIVTAVPLLLFAASARRLPLTVLGLIQYLTPVLQFAVGVWIRHEPLPPAEFVGFGLVWAALVVLTVDGIRAQRARTRRPAALADASGD